ncbi:MAG: four helix bundle protein [Rickettsiales bacterium]
MDDSKHRSYEDLKVWQKAVSLSKDVYRITKNFPKDEIYGLTSQIRRSAVSVSSNIAEGCGRNSYGEFVQFLGIASGSLAELHTQLIIAVDVNYLSKIDFDVLLTQIVEIGRMIAGLKSSLKNKNSSNKQLVTSN